MSNYRFPPASRAPEPDASRARGPADVEEDGAVILACCAMSLTLVSIAVFGTGSWPMIEAWLLGWVA